MYVYVFIYPGIFVYYAYLYMWMPYCMFCAGLIQTQCVAMDTITDIFNVFTEKDILLLPSLLHVLYEDNFLILYVSTVYWHFKYGLYQCILLMSQM